MSDGELALVYEGSHGRVVWRGVRVPASVLDALRSGGLHERLLDSAARGELVDDLRALATTELGTEFLKELINSEPTPVAWEVGEALAEALLEQHHGAMWPWNSARDKRTPRASLPGADLVGFVEDRDGVALLFGEVKTSSDVNNPPGVVLGRSGLARQLEGLAERKDLRWQLLRWLQARCHDPHVKEKFKRATQRFLVSGGEDFFLIGCLMRDTDPNERDLSGRGEALSVKLNGATNVQLLAWYFPVSTADWPTWAEVPDSA